MPIKIIITSYIIELKLIYSISGLIYFLNSV